MALAMAFTACGSGSSTGSDSDSTATDTVVKVSMNPEAFPVNAIPDNQFGKAMTETADPSLKAVPKSLDILQETLPAWLDAIVSRESIVAFGKVMAEQPDETEFVQQEAHVLEAGGGWKAFWVNFKTRPSNGSIVVWGAYASEQEVYWASTTRKGPMSFLIGAVEKTTDGVNITGAMSTDKDPQTPFRASLTKTAAQLTLGGK